MTIYVVTSGDYSDYHICGVFSTQEKAQQYIKVDAGNTDFEENYRIEQYKLDEMYDLILLGLNKYVVNFDFEFNVKKVTESSILRTEARKNMVSEWGKLSWGGILPKDFLGWSVTCFAQNEHLGVKIATEILHKFRYEHLDLWNKRQNQFYAKT